MCTHPKKLYKVGKYKEDNYNGKKGDEYQIDTFTKCGVCPECIAEKANNWVIRNNYESKQWNKISFITLTYAKNPKTLIKKDLQDFFKRLRRQLEYGGYKEKIRYFAVGEYGTKHGRPHYHAIIYNWEEIINKLQLIDINKKQNLVFQSELIQKAWGLGRTSFQRFESHEIPYISLYCTPAETFAKAYKLNKEKAKQLIKEIKEDIKQMKGKALLKRSRVNQYKEILKLSKIATKNKEEYIMIKEFNTWSKGIGWKQFYKEYDKYGYNWEEYIDEMKFVTPTPWIKKLANMGDENAIKEMRRRANYEIDKNLSAEQLQIQNKLKEQYNELKENIKYSEQKQLLEEL